MWEPPPFLNYSVHKKKLFKTLVGQNKFVSLDYRCRLETLPFLPITSVATEAVDGDGHDSYLLIFFIIVFSGFAFADAKLHLHL